MRYGNCWENLLNPRRRQNANSKKQSVSCASSPKKRIGSSKKQSVSCASSPKKRIGSFQETERLLREQSQETERLLREQSQETERFLREQSQETDRKFQETDRLLREESKRVNNQIGQLGNRLGEFVESQVRPAAVKLFQERGIAVKEIASNTYIQTGKEGLEIDLLVINSSDIILIEAKSKVSEDDVNEHLERLSKFKRFFPRYESYRVLGAVAGMVIPLDVSRYAYRKGLFVIGQSGDNLVILNDDKFRPRGW
ncbi:hypothetical protein CRC_02243 [Cylindrospermopsis raciborskii CS-505]|nr:hypothetical protein CRC_02243 [Cylindrospermopsis raciborskii CS-505]